jgi:hypothetical protein
MSAMPGDVKSDVRPVWTRLVDAFYAWQSGPRGAVRVASSAYWYQMVGARSGRVAAVCVFVGAYAWCISHYGFLFGLGLGWLSAGILASVTYLAFRYLWALLGVTLALAVVLIALQPPPKPGEAPAGMAALDGTPLDPAAWGGAPTTTLLAPPGASGSGKILYYYDPAKGTLEPASATSDPLGHPEGAAGAGLVPPDRPDLYYDPRTGGYSAIPPPARAHRSADAR